MYALEQLILGNAVVATVLALLASAVGLVCRRPALIHSLWLLVLIKLITPPIWQVELFQLPTSFERETAEVSVLSFHPPTKVEDVDLRECQRDREQLEADEELVFAPQGIASPEPQDAAPRDLPIATNLWNWPVWRPLFLTVWLSGSLGCFLLAGIRVIRFQWLLRWAEPAS